MARKRNIFRQKRKKRGARIFWTLVTFLLVATAIIWSLTVFLKVSDVEVYGNTYYTAEQLIDSSGIKTGDRLYGINKFDAIEKIKKDFPYIDEVKITRKLPGTFVFEITERKPCGYIKGEDCLWIVDTKGVLLEKVDATASLRGALIESGETLVTPFVGGSINWETDSKFDALVYVMEQLDSRGLIDKATGIDVSATYSIEFRYEDRLTVILGNTEDMEKKMNMFAVVLPQLSATDKGRLNLSNLGEARFTPERVVYNEK